MAQKKLKQIKTVFDITAAMAWERISAARPKAPPAIPATFEAITSQWLTAALCAEVPGAKVESHQLLGGSSGSTSRRIIALKYNPVGESAGLPKQVFAKSTLTFTQRMTAALSMNAMKESRYFNDIQPELDIESTRAYFSGYELPCWRSMILMEVRDDCTYTNPTHTISRSQAEDMVRLLANLHGHYWQSPRFDSDLGWLQPAMDYHLMLSELGFEERCDIGNERAKAVFSEAVYDRRQDIFPALWKSMELAENGPQTVIHNDVHIGNWYKTPHGRMGLCDWQALGRGSYATDLSYAVSSALTVDDRRAWEADLIRLYVEEIRRTGKTDLPDFEQAWLSYRQQQFHALIFWTFTIGAGALQADMQPDEHSLINIERMSQAIADLNSFGSLGI
jgi:thiamine kinase-like enzyme